MKFDVVMVGLGYIGLPTTYVMAMQISGYQFTIPKPSKNIQNPYIFIKLSISNNKDYFAILDPPSSFHG